MLRSFRVANHRSIRDEQELVLLPAYDKKREVVPVTAIFGANASGKSNLVDALRFMQSAVRTSYGSWEPGAGIPRTPFMLDPLARREPSLFTVELDIAGDRYNYGFTIDDQVVVEEWLYHYPHERRRILFERHKGHIKLGSTLPDYRSRREVLSGLTRENALFLSAAAHANQSEFQPVYEWFRTGLVVTGGDDGPGLSSLTSRLMQDAPGRDLLVALIRCADLGIVDIVIDDKDRRSAAVTLNRADAAYREARNRVSELQLELAGTTPDQRVAAEELLQSALYQLDDATKLLHDANMLYAQNTRRPNLVFLHTSSRSPLSLQQQSDGTHAWLRLIVRALPVLEAGSLLVVDEIDTSLHPRLTARLVELFKDDRTNRRGAQLVFTTHDATLLGTSLGRDVLARDEIWFIDKSADGSTVLFPLTDFHPRKDENTERRYLGGSYGAVPAVFSDSLVDEYLAGRPELLDDSA